uniref:Uncharacterized protein n=1 Tax=Gasterosteus aculeatus TaxID=69293 RepID=G3P9E9_GASAC
NKFSTSHCASCLPPPHAAQSKVSNTKDCREQLSHDFTHCCFLNVLLRCFEHHGPTCCIVMRVMQLGGNLVRLISPKLAHLHLHNLD